MINLWISKYGCNSKLVQTKAKHSWVVVAYFSCARFRFPGQPLSGFLVPCGFTCIKAKPICFSHASLSRVKYPFLHCKASTCADTCLSTNIYNELCSPCVRVSNIFGLPFLVLSLSSAAMWTKLSTKCPYTWQNQRDDFNSGTLRGNFKSLIASVVWSVGSNSIGCIEGPYNQSFQ